MIHDSLSPVFHCHRQITPLNPPMLWLRCHWCQLNVKPIARLGINSQSNSKSCLLMTKNPQFTLEGV
ncbi:MAG: hypothetical protein PT120_11575 [Aphanizomenon gracile PMC649.10]|nr:hypothetical protein [Aphanizomenon gracile PMC649.10]